MVNFRIRFYSQELLFFIYDSSLPVTDIHDHQNNFTDSIFFGTTESFWNICTINTVHNCKSWYFIVLFAYFNLVENKIPLYWFILLFTCYSFVLKCQFHGVNMWTKRHHARFIILFHFSTCSRLGQTCFCLHFYLHFVLHAIHVAYTFY